MAFLQNLQKFAAAQIQLKFPLLQFPLHTGFIDISVNIKHRRRTSFLHVCVILSALPFNFLFSNINNNVVNMSFYLGFLTDPGGIFNSDVINNPNKLSHD